MFQSPCFFFFIIYLLFISMPKTFLFVKHETTFYVLYIFVYHEVWLPLKFVFSKLFFWTTVIILQYICLYAYVLGKVNPIFIIYSRNTKRAWYTYIECITCRRITDVFYIMFGQRETYRSGLCFEDVGETG